MVKSYLTQNPSGTKKLGEKLAKRILKEKLEKRAFVIGLTGELGGGKTTFLQGFAKGLGIKEKILSPTFVILKKFKITKIKNHWTRSGLPGGFQSKRNKFLASESKKLGFKNFYHIDCYRINSPKEILGLGLKEIISRANNIVAIEWADRLQTILPQNALILRFKFVNENTREITISERRKTENACPQLLQRCRRVKPQLKT